MWGFPGIGKSFIADGEKIIDADCQYFQYKGVSMEGLHGDANWGVAIEPEYPENYIRYVNGVNAEIVLINCHISLLSRFENVEVVYPVKELKEEYLKRYQQRGDNESFVAYMNDSFEQMVDAIVSLPYPRYSITEKGMYLSDVILHPKNNIKSLIGKGWEMDMSFSEDKELKRLIEDRQGYSTKKLSELVLKGIKDGTVKLIDDPNGDEIVAQIGDSWFYFENTFTFECNMNEQYKDKIDDEWGSAFVWNGKDTGVEYNYCVEGKEEVVNSSAIYKMELNEAREYMETDCNKFSHYEIDFNDDDWRGTLEKEMKKVYCEFFPEVIAKNIADTIESSIEEESKLYGDAPEWQYYKYILEERFGSVNINSLDKSIEKAKTQCEVEAISEARQALLAEDKERE